jgi:hypothetical protein
MGLPRVAATYRGESSLLPPRVPLARTSGVRKGGTKGAGTRPGLERDAAEALAFEWDLDGVQLASLSASKLVFLAEPFRANVCAGDGRHPCGLILVRPRRAACGVATCLCAADTRSMAYRIGKAVEVQPRTDNGKAVEDGVLVVRRLALP